MYNYDFAFATPRQEVPQAHANERISYINVDYTREWSFFRLDA
jgi:hypothetical protein